MTIDSASPFSTRKTPKNGVDYPLRFFNMLIFERPENIRDIFKWCTIFYRSSGFLREIIDKISRYPVTTVEVTGDTADTFWNKLLNEDLNIRETIVRLNVNKNTYGNVFVSVIPLFKRYLKCPKCESYHNHPIEKMKYTFRNFKFYSKCLNEECKFTGELECYDEFEDTEHANIANNINIKIWPTASIHIKQNAVTGKTKLFYKLSKNEVDGIMKGDRFVIETMPSDFIDAVKMYGKSAAVELEEDKTFWYKTEDLEEPNPTGFGLPFYFSAWKTMFQIFVHRKAQECIVSDHMLPYRVMYPETHNGADPIGNIDLGQWRNSISNMIHRWYNDPNEIGELPFPVGFQQLGGQGKAMSLTAEIEDLHKSLLIECGIPPELIFGGMSWTGSSVTLRMLENRFMYETNADNHFLKKLCKFIAAHFKRKAPDDVKLSPFRMADDIAKANMFLGLAAQGKISYQRALGVLGENIDFKKEAEIIWHEREASAKAQTALQGAAAEAASEAGRINAREQVITQIQSQELQNTLSQSMGSPLVDHATITTPMGFINELNQMDEATRQATLQDLQIRNPEYYQQILQTMGMGAPPVAAGPSKPSNQPPNGKPLPDKMPPRSEGANRRI